jgi:hypothetical protein
LEPDGKAFIWLFWVWLQRFDPGWKFPGVSLDPG